ncbi:HisJ family histidinol phosphate phosphatase [Thermincola ferriacetica]|uniref:Histidinol-phosphatase n=1 Tax=Thermincola ferriacetica TaxID=281456 RepID=A0A0L6W4I8_9FIRM|nr:histidinol-phosphatase [Thermincola ferriacetica]KNZ70482.1 HisJ family histidinol phosphate phosphatase [Thermincola ferriacetica]
MLIDYHMHTKMCGHAEGEMEEYVLKAKREGIVEIGVADHIPMYFLPAAERDPSIAMAEEELPIYVKAVEKLQKQFYPYNIKLGIEADFDPDCQAELKRIINAFPFDYVLGSIHFLGRWGFDNPRFIDEYQKRDIDEVYAEYFNLLEKAAASGHFDILAHPDLVKKLNFRPRKDITYIYERLAKCFADADICIEINTAGLRAPVGEIYPSAVFLRECFKRRVPVTLGSDAHTPEQVGACFPEAKQLLLEIGYDKIAVFSQRKRRLLPL